MATEDANEQRGRRTRDAWNEYLAQTKGLKEPRYEEVEPWAWARLQRALNRADREARYDLADHAPATRSQS